MAAVPPEHEAFWAAAEALHPELRQRERFLEAFAFGDGPALADELAALVLQGAKRATASLPASHAHDGRACPKAGDLSIVTSGAGQALCIIETTRVDVMPFGDVDDQFARAEGEGDGTLASWRRNHEAFFGAECRRIGRTFDAGLAVACEHFRVVFQVQGARGQCLCGSVRFRAGFPSKWVAHCHCTYCRRAHGAPFVTWAGFEDERFAVEAGAEALSWFVSSPGAERAFCSRCGSPMFFRAQRWPGEMHVARALFTEALDRVPAAHVFYEKHVPWLQVGDALPKKVSTGSA